MIIGQDDSEEELCNKEIKTLLRCSCLTTSNFGNAVFHDHSITLHGLLQ